MSLKASSRLSGGSAAQNFSAFFRSLGRSSIQAPLCCTRGLRLPASRSSSLRVKVTPPIISCHDHSRFSPRLKPRPCSGSSALIARPSRLASPPLRLGGSTTPTPTSRSLAAAVRTNTNASAGASSIASGAAASSPRARGSKATRARPRPSRSSSPGCSTWISPSCSTPSPAFQTAAALWRRLASASACRPKRKGHSSLPSGGVSSSSRARAGATWPATVSRQREVALISRALSSSLRARIPSPGPRACCQPASSGSNPSDEG